jgi:superfamily II DNA or RNA helicase
MKQTVSIAHNAVNAKLVGADRDAKLLAREALSFLVDGAEHMTAFGPGRWDGRSSFFDFKSETFPAGFVYLVWAKLRNAGYPVNLVRKPFPVPLGAARPKVDEFPEDPDYEYQYEVTRKLLKHGQIIAQVATGGGKSRIARITYKTIGRTTMFLTTRSTLMYQMGNGIEADLKERVGYIGDDQWNPNIGGFTGVMVQTLAPLLEVMDPETEVLRYMKNRDAAEDREVDRLLKAAKKKAGLRPEYFGPFCKKVRERLEASRKPDREIVADIQARCAAHVAKRKRALDYLSKVELIILEEAHEVSGDGFYTICRAATNAHYRLSLTATPFMKDSAEANMKLMAVSGVVAIKVTEKDLIDRGILAKPYFKFIELREQAPSFTEQVDGKNVTHRLYRSTPWPKCYEIGVVNNAERNAAIVYETTRAVKHGLTAMVLVQHKAHGRLLQSELLRAGVKVNFIFGEHDQNDRQAALNALKDKRIDVLIGSTILDVGVDVPAVGMIVIAGAGKAEVQMRQRIGRGLRKKRNGPNCALVVDFIDPPNNHIRTHSVERIQIVKSTPGFVEGIVANDFDYTGMGFIAKAA